MIPQFLMGNPQPTVGIVAAIDEELCAISKRLTATRRWDDGRVRFIEGRLADQPVVIARTGEGRGNATHGTRLLLEHTRVSQLIIIGFCGGLSPGLAPGTVLIGRRLVDGEQAVQPAGPAAVDGGSLPAATFVTLDRMLCSVEHKRAAWEEIGGRGVAVVDTETAAVARVAESRGVPYVAIRAVSDTAEESLPLDFNRFVDGTGRVDRLGVAAHAARHPKVIGSLWKLRGRTKRCSEMLADAVSEWIDRGLA
jgi:adenosylhomocysteine nucleosidase